MSDSPLARSRALWNRSTFDLNSDETLAQLLDRGSLEDFRELYRLAQNEHALRRRITDIIVRVPLATPYFWLAALTALGDTVDYDSALPDYYSDVGGT
ncbi:MAG: hypothetical protein RL701_4682 [Pseudomonadota bacterium]|jgi:hypothetical protein